LHFAPLATALDRLQTLGKRLARGVASPPGRMGVAGRLATAFVAVAILAVAANLLVLRGVSTVRTVHWVPQSRTADARQSQADQRQIASTEAMTGFRTAALMAAMGQYHRAIERRADSVTDAATNDLRLADTALRTEAARLAESFTTLTSSDAGSTGGAAELSRLASRLRARGDEVIRAADQRRALRAAYWESFERADSRLKAALDRNWKILGRVIARQSLVSLNRDLDEVRRYSAHLGTSDNINPETLSLLEQAQQRFIATLDKHTSRLQRSQGESWVRAIHEDFSQSVALRSQLALAESEVPSAFQALEATSSQMRAHLRSIAENSAAHADRAGAHHPTPEQSPLSGVTESSMPDAAERTTTVVEPNQGAQLLIAAISVAVLLLLLAICVATVRSIVKPIRRLIATAARLGRGETDVRVATGGLREMDSLASAFNQMAQRLQAAQALTRDYQAQLEARVDERTRQLQHLAEHDPLTGLPNRRQLISYLQSAIREASRDSTRVGVFFLDLDNFKNINDSMGHAFGDKVLERIALRLREATESSGFAARLGGDEFTVIYEDAQSMEEICSFGAELVCAFQKPLIVEGRDLLVGVSVGASMYPEHETDADALLRAADAALFEAKTTGRSRLSVFSPELLAAASLKFRIEQGLRHASERGEFELLFQPEVSFDVLGTKVVEALLRWRLPDGSHVPPAEFLPVAEESGLIMTISDWVLSSAIETAARWHRGEWPDVRVAINVSARQLLDSQFVDRVWNILSRHRLPAHCIEIELTENVLQTGPATIETLRRLREIGVAIALDDFGTGYSSLSSLEQLPLTRVKLDRSLIASIDRTSRSLAIARAIIGLCRSLRLEVTAEGVERPEQLALLVDHPAVCLQGYLISKPVEADAVLPVVAGMPQHLQSLLLTSAAPGNTGHYEQPVLSQLQAGAIR
jgi:diguanylate cyclase (GGDEF)-like protein